MKNGFKVFDTDTHIAPSAESLEPYISPRVRELIPDLDERKVPIKTGLAGEVRQEPYRHHYRLGDGESGGWANSAVRVLGEAGPREGVTRRFQTFMGTRHPTDGGQEYADVRIRDMDEEGTDVHMMVPNGANGHANPEVEMEFIRAQHRYLDELTHPYPHRLKSLIVVSARDVEGSLAEIERWAGSQWAVGIQAYMPLDYPIDHPDLEPLWAAAQDHDLGLVHHSFATGYPGYRDLWSNPFIGRSASHPWAAMRFVAAVTASGMLDRHPRLRFGILESGFGWLPFWARRLDDQMEYVGYVNEQLKFKPSEYMSGGRFFSSIEMHEGGDMAALVTESMGDGVLMLGTDYPHAESRFPESVDRVVEWQKSGLSDEALHKLLWDNAVRFFGEP
jgi:predicted TIM-barrel fold metal-dependent hydrolase